MKILEIFPQYTVSQHLWHVLRSKGGKVPYSWSNKELLSKLEVYYDELIQDLTDADS